MALPFSTDIQGSFLKRIEKRSTSISSEVRFNRIYMPATKLTLISVEGVLVAKKDFNLPKHGEIDTKNLYVCQAFPLPMLLQVPLT